MRKILLLAWITSLSLIVSAQKYAGSRTANTPEEKLNEQYCSALFKNADGTIFDLVNANQSVKGYLNVLNWLEGRVAGLQVYTSRMGVRIPYIRGNYARIYVDEIPVDPGYLNTLPVTDIAMIKVIKGPFVGNIGGSGGAIAIYTIQGEDDEEDME